MWQKLIGPGPVNCCFYHTLLTTSVTTLLTTNMTTLLTTNMTTLIALSVAREISPSI